MTTATIILTSLGLLIAGLTFAATLWSALWPDRRIWPPDRAGAATVWAGWIATLVFFAAALGLGLLGWGQAVLPAWLRFGVGPILILAGNAAIWSEVSAFGAEQTMGAEGELKTDGLYRYSRNPQYVADIAILLGWGMLSGSPLALPVIGAGIIVLVAFPVAEEPWLEERYGAAYRHYRSRVRRFL